MRDVASAICLSFTDSVKPSQCFQTFDAVFPKDLFSDSFKKNKKHPGKTSGLRSLIVALTGDCLSHVLRLWYFSSSLNSLFKRTCAAIQWG